ncbi:DUF418 domain-containing protein [Desertihabitans aurantiacus]|uniref:DUF418 domain-containing protein n=1 Tax=Desertihabitans aurantiacus TaxID=2282477 RepID=UPI0018E50B59|nr:DUF418 domain-containing protein [Desertihabitans aurantiacus]
MLLFIALGNAHYFLRGGAYLGGFPLGGSAVDRAVAWLVATVVDGRSYPMFALLFGYGVAHIVRRNAASGRPATRRLLWRRSGVLVAVGVLDGFLFFSGDILAAYGVLLLVGAWAVFWRDAWLLAIATAFFAVVSLPGGFSTEGPGGSFLPTDVPSMLIARAGDVMTVALAGPIGFVCPFLVGVCAGRPRLLEQPAARRRLLRLVAVAGIGLAIVGAQPVALAVAGVTAVPEGADLAMAGAMHTATGVLGGFGYAALLALVADGISARRGPVVRALAATGQRSMTCYLVQSLVWAVVFTPFLLDLSDALNIASTAPLAIVVWLSTVVLADQLDRRGHRGPFESLVRRLTYGRPSVEVV